MKHVLPIFLFFLCISTFSLAQDTIAKTNGDLISAKVTEISSEQVKYKKFNFQDGPTYVENKSDIKYIKYTSGLKEEFAPAQTEIKIADTKSPPETTTATTDYYDPNGSKTSSASSTSSSKKLQTWGMGYRYDGHSINEKKMQRLLLDTKDKEIIGMVQIAKESKAMQYIGFAAIPLGIAGLALASGASGTGSNSGGQMVAGGILIVGAVACPIASGLFKHRRTNNNRAAIARYNQLY